MLGLKTSSLNDLLCTFSSTCNSKILTRTLLSTIISFNIMLCFGQKSILILLTHQRKVADQISFTLIQIITLQWTLFNYTIVLALSNFSNFSFKKGSLFYNIFHFHICSVFIFQFDLTYIKFFFWVICIHVLPLYVKQLTSSSFRVCSSKKSRLHNVDQIPLLRISQGAYNRI